MESPNHHRPVLSREALEALSVSSTGYYVDGTFGRGGHSRLILAALGEEGRLLAIDKDPEAVAAARVLAEADHRLSVQQGSFALLSVFAEQLGWGGRIAGVLLDLGVSSPQLDTPERGFSFLQDGPLDMRMDNSRGMSAAQWLATAGADEIARVLKEYGEERFSKRIAAKILAERQGGVAIETTGKLAGIVASAVSIREKGKHPATRSFQAIRIFINQELDDLRKCLEQALDLLAPGGRLVVICFHSLEDRIVKRFIRDAARGDIYPPGIPVTHNQMRPRLKVVGKVIHPTVAEVNLNPRARSAVLRVAEKLS
ncbi:MAG: 16S rRNA (cytosine(1402)-N(4))-methyltransferase RsmH [Gammaproteobacteria bacterium]|nr:16S rRNA (cytosine(1402)-N(4))-methyltransferase RsmH [Gammaproteobacteria bacterium]